MTALPVGTVTEILTGGGPEKERIWGFIRDAHHAEACAGVSFVGISVNTSGQTWLLVDGDKDKLTAALFEAEADVAEVLRLENLQ